VGHPVLSPPELERVPRWVRIREFYCRGGGWLVCLLQFAAVPFWNSDATLLCMKILTRLMFLGSLFLAPVLLHAQDSCVDSPECPTAILGVVGAAGAALYVRWRSR